MALYIPIHLWRRTSRVYQDLCTFSVLVLTSFVPPAHNQGVSLAPCQGLALWKIFLPTTGSFFVNITFTDWLPVTALFPADVPLPRSAFPSASQQFFQSSVLFPAWLRSTDSSLCIWLLTSTTSVFLRTATAYLLMQPVLPLSGLLISPSIFSPS